MRLTMLLIFTIQTLCLVKICNSAKILGYLITFSKSHLIVHESVMQTLIDRGHNVTIVTTLPLNNLKNSFRHIHLDVPEPPKDLISGMIKKAQGPLGHFGTVLTFFDFTMEYNSQALQDPQMKRLMSEETFDLVVVGYFFNTFQFGVGVHFQCPLVVSFMQRPMKHLNDYIGNPWEVTYVPNVIIGNSHAMDFWQRLKNIGSSILFDLGVFSIMDYKSKQHYDRNFPPSKYPSYSEALRNVSLVLSNYHFSQGVIRATVPAFVEIGGIQVKPKPDLLPKDIDEFLNASTPHGAIYFSLGSNARSADLNPKIIQNVYQVLAGLKQRVIWKWENDQLPGNASNILFKKWLPQDDILAHPNVQLFITHGGHGSVVESEYHGVPMVGLPLFADQFSNMQSVQEAGYGLSLSQDDITVEKFRSTLLEVLENPSYREKVQAFSRLYRDRPMNARDTAAYWMEYVIRHKGAKHMQSPAVHMNFIEYYGLDVFAFLLAVCYVVFKLTVFVCRQILFLIFGRKSKGNSKSIIEKKVQ